jgi:pilus assembly protein CpaB
MIVVLAFLLAAGATGAVYLYVNGVKQEAKSGGELATVIVAKSDIAAGTLLDPLIEQGSFREAEVPANDLVQGAVTQLTQLRGQTTTAAVLAGEQIPTARLSSGVLPGGTLGIEDGYEAVSFRLDAQQVLGKAIQPGSHITLYATFSDVTIISGNLQQALHGGAPTTTQTQKNIGSYTLTLVPDTRVLAVDTSASPTQGAVDANYLLTLELTPQEAQNAIFAQSQGQVWAALLPPKGKGVVVPPTNVVQILLRKP